MPLMELRTVNLCPENSAMNAVFCRNLRNLLPIHIYYNLRL